MQILDGTDPRVKKFLGRIRTWMKDYSHKNRLIVDREASDENLLVCLEMALDEFNRGTTPRTNYGLANFPSYALLVYGTVIHALMSESFLQMRNRLSYTDGGITVAVSDKAGDYTAAMGNLRGLYEKLKNDVKVEANVAGALEGTGGTTGVASEYATVDFFY